MSAPTSPDQSGIERGKPWLACTGAQLRMVLHAALGWLDINHESINALNVFPVPDGDSGTNMLLTLRSAYDEIANGPPRGTGEMLHAVAKGALMGARGNSGVILSQFLRGMANTLDGKETMSAKDFAQALREGSRLAYKGVQKPVEGTMLTVSREMSDAAVAAAQESDDLRLVLSRTTAEAQRSVARTPSLLPTLAKAGVVDAGGQGIYVIMQGLLKFVNGERIESDERTGAEKADVTSLQAEEGWGFDIQCIIRGRDLDVGVIRDRIEAMGESVLVVGDQNTIKVHAHAPTPGPILDYCVAQGIVSRIIVENMEEQYQEILLAQQTKPPPVAEEMTGIAVIAVAQGAGIWHVFESLGTSRIVSGGATMNPSVQDLLKAIEEVEAQKVIVLPNDKNIILAAQQAAKLTEKAVRIIPSSSVPQGIAALMAFNFQADLDANAEAMKHALRNVGTGEITRAVRTVSMDGLDILEGQIIGLVNGALNVAGHDHNGVAREIMRKLNAGNGEVVTIYYGQDVTQAEADRLAADIRAMYPSLQVDVISGGQPHTHYILSAE